MILDSRSASARLASAPGYLGGVDGLRAIAVIGVVLYHLESALLPGGFAGVDVFFVISGYVVGRSLAGYGAQGAQLGRFLADFYSRRFVRLLPALVVCLLVSSLLAVLFVPASWLSDNVFRTGLYAYFGISNFALAYAGDDYYTPRAEFNPFTHTWSLAVEEQFYLVFPIIVYLWLRYRHGDTLKAAMASRLLLLLAGGSLLWAWQIADSHSVRAFYLTVYRFWELAVGGLLFQFQSKGMLEPRSRSVASLCLAAGLLTILSAFLFASPTEFPFPGALVPVIGTALAIAGAAALEGSRSGMGMLVSNRAMIYVGRISYSLYLWHWPVIVLFRWTVGLGEPVRIVAALVFSFALSAASYHFVESPARQYGRRRQARSPAVLAMGILVVLAGFGISQWMFKSQVDISLSVTADRRAWYPLSWPRPNQDFGEFGGRTLFVAGDSHAVAYNTLLQMLRDNDKLTVARYSQGGCPVVALFDASQERCARFIESTIAEIETTAKPGDIVFLPALRTPRLATDHGASDDKAVFASMLTPSTRAKYQKALVEADEILRRFESRSVRVILEAPKPVFRAMPYRCSDWFNASNPVCSAGMELPRAYIEEFRAPIMESIAALQAQHPALRVWDPLPALCPTATCSAFADGRPLFFDSDHLSAHGNRVLYPSLRALLSELYGTNAAPLRKIRMNTQVVSGLGSTGLSAAEPWGRWSDGDRVTFRFSAGLPKDGFRLMLEMNPAFGPIRGRKVIVTVGSAIRTFAAPTKAGTVTLDFPPGSEGAEVDTITLEIAGTQSPKSLGLSADSRRLGLALVGIEIAPATNPAQP
ncbi:MAG: SGNH hydrolase domain-containing protein [Pseudomonadota bacterium]|nr:SGNH hydrolase domain-containing protein [Pseudomonadota bacterium]